MVFHNNATTFRPYNPGEAIGDAMPILPPEPAPPPPPKPKKKGCGIIGQILAVVIAVVVTWATAGAASGAIGSSLGSFSGVAAGAVGGAAGSIASQGFLMATGAQSKFNWGGLAISAISGGVAKGLGGSEGFGNFVKGISGGSEFVAGAITQGTANIITQGISVAAGLQSRFDWTGVAVAGVMGGFSAKIGPNTFGNAANWSARGLANGLVQNGVSAFAGAATRVAIDGGDFGDALERAIPDVIGQTIGNLAAGRISQQNGTTATSEHKKTFLDDVFGAAGKALDFVGKGLTAAGDFLGFDGTFGYDGAPKFNLAYDGTGYSQRNAPASDADPVTVSKPKPDQNPLKILEAVGKVLGMLSRGGAAGAVLSLRGDTIPSINIPIAGDPHLRLSRDATDGSEWRLLSDKAGYWSKVSYGTEDYKVGDREFVVLERPGDVAKRLGRPLPVGVIEVAPLEVSSERSAAATELQGRFNDPYVRYNPSVQDAQINEVGILPSRYDGRVWFTKFSDVAGVTRASDLDKILYRQNLWPQTAGRFDSGATMRLIENVPDARFAGMTNTVPGVGVRQWFVQRSIPAPPVNAQIIKQLPGSR